MKEEELLAIFRETELRGAFVIHPEKLEDARGFFGRVFCKKEFEAHGLNPRFVQCNVAFNKKKGTLRGMHYQDPPFEETKLVRCTRGAVYDVIVDLRPASHTFKRWTSAELTSEDYRILYVPKGFAHGYQTLVDDTEVFYQVSEFYHPECERVLRWDDPEIAVQWPLRDKIMSNKDRNAPVLHDMKGHLTDG